MNDQRSSGELIRRYDDVFEPVTEPDVSSRDPYSLRNTMRYSRPTERKTKRRVTESRSITSETSRHGEPSSHLTKRSHDEEDDETNDRITDKDRARTSLRQGLASADDKTSADRTTNGNHGDVTGLETSVQRRLSAGLETADVTILADANVLGGSCRGIVAEIRLLDVVPAHCDEFDQVQAKNILEIKAKLPSASVRRPSCQRRTKLLGDLKAKDLGDIVC